MPAIPAPTGPGRAMTHLGPDLPGAAAMAAAGPADRVTAWVLLDRAARARLEQSDQGRRGRTGPLPQGPAAVVGQDRTGSLLPDQAGLALRGRTEVLRLVGTAVAPAGLTQALAALVPVDVMATSPGPVERPVGGVPQELREQIP